MAVEPLATTNRQLVSRLQSHGWASLTVSVYLEAAVIDVARGLGDVVRRRDGTMTEELSPRGREGTQKASLSRRFGLGAFPLHCDTAHLPLPCRYIVLGCQSTGAVRTPTLLLDTDGLCLSEPDKALAHSALFCVRNGRRSFYTSMLDDARPFLRVDPGCMEPIGEDAVDAMKLFSHEREETIAFEWVEGAILVIDNWRVLHGRGNEADADIGRRLTRAYVR